MKGFVICAAVVGLALSSSAQAKGCIKGAIVGGLAGHMAGYGKVGAAAGYAIGHHEANKSDAQKADDRACQCASPNPEIGSVPIASTTVHSVGAG